MKYILLIYSDERQWTAAGKETIERMIAEHGEYGRQMAKAGVIRGGAELKPVTTATSIRFTSGKPKTMDGPFAETKEQLGGYYVIDVDNLEQAIHWAEKMPGMSDGAVEIRPLGVGATMG
jgi:hypothetical protein